MCVYLTVYTIQCTRHVRWRRWLATRWRWSATGAILTPILGLSRSSPPHTLWRQVLSTPCNLTLNNTSSRTTRKTCRRPTTRLTARTAQRLPQQDKWLKLGSLYRATSLPLLHPLACPQPPYPRALLVPAWSTPAWSTCPWLPTFPNRHLGSLGMRPAKLLPAHRGGGYSWPFSCSRVGKGGSSRKTRQTGRAACAPPSAATHADLIVRFPLILATCARQFQVDCPG